MSDINTHNLIVDFGKHKGERWTRIPLSYLKWAANELQGERQAIAESELNRRGDTTPVDVEISNHAIDRASLRVRKSWHRDRGKDEGLYSWLLRVIDEVDLSEEPREVSHKGVVFIVTYGNYYPTVLSIKPDRKYKFKEIENE